MSSPHPTRHYDDLTIDQRRLLAQHLVARAIVCPSGCWELQGYQMHSGHLHLSIGSRVSVGRGLRTRARQPFARVRAHVFAWEMAHACAVPADRVVMHDCDNPPCVNPAHLILGTQAENVRDSVEKGRHGLWHKTGVRLNGRLPNVAYRILEETERS